MSSRLGERPGPSGRHYLRPRAIPASMMAIVCVVALGVAVSTALSAHPAHPARSDASVPGIGRLVVYGHSIPAGRGASDEQEKGYPTLAAETTGLELVNWAEGRTVAAAALRAATASDSTGPGDAVVIHTGLNDIFRWGHDAVRRGRETIREILRRTSAAGRRVLVLDCQPAAWPEKAPGDDVQTAYEEWNSMLLDEAATWPDVEVLETCQTWDTQRFTDDSGFHPNDEGHKRLAKRLVDVLTKS
jgi:lysophospholipase L1-like esterase